MKHFWDCLSFADAGDLFYHARPCGIAWGVVKSFRAFRRLSTIKVFLRNKESTEKGETYHSRSFSSAILALSIAVFVWGLEVCIQHVVIASWSCFFHCCLWWLKTTISFVIRILFLDSWFLCTEIALSQEVESENLIQTFLAWSCSPDFLWLSFEAWFSFSNSL